MKLISLPSPFSLSPFFFLPFYRLPCPSRHTIPLKIKEWKAIDGRVTAPDIAAARVVILLQRRRPLTGLKGTMRGATKQFNLQTLRNRVLEAQPCFHQPWRDPCSIHTFCLYTDSSKKGEEDDLQEAYSQLSSGYGTSRILTAVRNREGWKNVTKLD